MFRQDVGISLVNNNLMSLVFNKFQIGFDWENCLVTT